MRIHTQLSLTVISYRRMDCFDFYRRHKWPSRQWLTGLFDSCPWTNAMVIVKLFLWAHCVCRLQWLQLHYPYSCHISFYLNLCYIWFSYFQWGLWMLVMIAVSNPVTGLLSISLLKWVLLIFTGVYRSNCDGCCFDSWAWWAGLNADLL